MLGLCEIKIECEILGIEVAKNKKGYDYLKIKAKQYKDSSKKSCVFLSIFKHKEIEEIEDNYKVGDIVEIFGDFDFTDYRTQDGTYKTSYIINLNKIKHIEDFSILRGKV